MTRRSASTRPSATISGRIGSSPPLVDLDQWLAAHVDGGPVLASSPIGSAAPPEARPLAQSETFLTLPLGLYFASRSHAGRPWTLSSGWDAGVVLARHLVSELHVFPLGVGRRLGREGVVYAMTGAGVSAIGRDVGFELPLFASLELQASAGVRLLGWLRVSRILGDQDRADPETGGGLAVRFGRNRRHWPGVRWSERTIVGLILQETGETLLLGVVYGSHFFSSN